MPAKKPTRRAPTRARAAAARKTPRRRPLASRGKPAFKRLEEELPTELRDFSRRVRRDLTRLERQIDTARRDARRRWTKVLREVSHQLGQLEAQGERRWRRLNLQARRDAVKALRRLERAIEPPKRKRKVSRAQSKAKPAPPLEARGAAI
jgi:hypothetical protein